MSQRQKALTIALWGLMVISMTAWIAAWSGARTRHTNAFAKFRAAVPEVPSYDVPNFSLTNQDGRTVSNTDLKGQVWIAAFMFTNCAGTCPMMSSKMSQLQKMIPDSRVKLVSFTLDPERDTPAVLKQYAAKFGADSQRWYFLTGDKTKIAQLALDLKLPTQIDTVPLIHSDRFILIDRNGQTRGYFTGTDDDQIKRLASAATNLASTPTPQGGSR